MKLLVSIYIVMFIFTFAREYNRIEGTSENLFIVSQSEAATRGIFTGIVWPLYWSVVKYDDIIRLVNERI